MRRLILAGLLVLSIAPLAQAQSNFYKLRNGNSVTPMGQELIVSTNTMCTEFARVKSHFLAQTQQRNSASDYTLIAEQWGVLDVSTNAPSETQADMLYQELNSMISNAGPSLEQWCARVKQ